MSIPNARPVRFVIFHRPGPKWQMGVDFREQDGVGEHVQHYLKLHEQGRLELGGPFLLQDAGGMMVATKDVSQEELKTFACGDTTFLEFFDQAMAAEVWGGKVEELNIGTRYRHFCLEVTGLDDFCKMLTDNGVQVSPISLGMDNSRQAWIADPDGNAIELMEYGFSSLQLTG